jgi:hypothetical protein
LKYIYPASTRARSHIESLFVRHCASEDGWSVICLLIISGTSCKFHYMCMFSLLADMTCFENPGPASAQWMCFRRAVWGSSQLLCLHSAARGRWLASPSLWQSGRPSTLPSVFQTWRLLLSRLTTPPPLLFFCIEIFWEVCLRSFCTADFIWFCVSEMWMCCV